MHHTQNIQYRNLLKSSQDQRGGTGPGKYPGPLTKEGDYMTIISRELSGGEAPNSFQSSSRASSSSTVMDSVARTPSDKISYNQAEEKEEPESPLSDAVNEKIVDLVKFLLLKFQRKELTTKAEMLNWVTSDYEEHYPVIFREASEYMKLFFGIDVVEVNPVVHYYVPVIALGITYDGMLHGPQGIANIGLITLSLCIIFMEGNCVPEEKFWGILTKLRFHPGRNHFLYGDHRKLITEEFVQEGYLGYRLVADSDPPHHAFLWGPRAHTETTKMKVLEFFASITRSDPQSYTERYAEALRGEGGEGLGQNCLTHANVLLTIASSGALAVSK